MRNRGIENKIEIKQYLDNTVLILCGILFFVSIISKDANYFIWPIDIGRVVECITNILLIIGLIKIYIYFDTNRNMAIIATAMLAFFAYMKAIGYCDYFYLLACIVACFNTSFDSISKIYVAVVSSNLLVRFFLAFLGLIDNERIFYSARFIKNIYSVGYSSHNTFMGFWLFLMMDLISVLRFSGFYYYIMLIICLGISLILFLLTGSNTATIICVLFLATAFFSNVIEMRVRTGQLLTIKKRVLSFLVYMPIYALIILYVGLVVYGRFGYINSIWTLMDRYGLFYRALLKLGVPVPYADRNIEPLYDNINYSIFWGMRGYKFNGIEYFDIEYAKIIIENGIIVLSIYLLLQVILLYRLKSANQFLLFICYCCTVLYGCFEGAVINYFGCAIFLLLAFSDYRRVNQRKNAVE